MFAVNGSHAPADLKQHLTRAATPGMKNPHAVTVTLDEAPVELRLRGTKPATLGRVNCWIPSLKARARSLNHAYRLISEKFEPQRISHSGNVFELGYCIQSDLWVSLDSLRKTVVAKFEMQLSRTSAQVLEQLSARVGSELRGCWLGDLQTPEVLLKELNGWQSQLKHHFSESALVGIQNALHQLRQILTSISDATPEEDVRLIHAAVKYLLRESGEEHYTKPSVGFNDEVLVVRTIAKATQPLGSND